MSTATGNTTSFVAACKSFFGLKEGQTNMDFLKEIKNLNGEDRTEIRLGLIQNGFIIDELVPMPVKTPE